MSKVIVGKRYEFLWPRQKPWMRMVGDVIAIRKEDFGEIAIVKFDPNKKPHEVILSRARIKPSDEPGCWQYRGMRIPK